jgi:autotransporter-associated beta strand protein
MQRFRGFLVLTAVLVLGGSGANAQIPAFPGAEGFGAYATGGRGGDVYYVMNLNTSGAGSFADAIATVPSSGRTIVFAVSGYIHVNKTSLSKSKVTIAGQTAPGDGIGFKDGSFYINGSDVVIQHARFRYGDQTAGGDCIDIGNGVTNLILDHVSVGFSTDENLSSFEQNPRPDLVSFQWSLNAWGLESHSCGGLWDLGRVTTHHTLWAHNHTRNPKARPDGLLDWINNVTFDWDIGFIMGDSTTPASWQANVRGSYFICPPGNTRSVALEKASLDRNGAYNFTLHVSTNLFDKNGNSVLDGSDYGYGIASGRYQVSNAPIVVAGAQVPVAIDPPLTAYKKILSRAGPLRLDALATTPLRDEVDTILINNLTGLKPNHVSSESGTGASNGGMGYLNSTPAPLDTDRDGMPNLWEQTLGWNVAADDHNTALPNSGGFVTGLTFFPPNTVAGYTRLEEYLYFLTIPHATIGKNTTDGTSSLTADLRRFVSGFRKATVAFSLSDITNGTAVLRPDGYTVLFTPTLGFSGRARFDFTVTDGDGSTWTQTLAVLVSSVGVPRDLKWKGDGSANLWNTNALNFLAGTTVTAYAPGDNVLFDDTGSYMPAVSVGLAFSPGLVEVGASQDYTIEGAGSLGGAMSLVKDGPGALTLGTTNSYSGGTVLNDGLLVLSNSTTAAGGGAITFSGGNLALLAPGGPATYNNPIIVTAPATIFTHAGASFNQALGGAVTGTETLSFNIASGSQFSPRSGMSLGGFGGTLQLTGPGTFRWYGGTGSSSTAFDLGVNGVMVTRDGGTITLGSLSGGTGSTLRGANNTVAATTYVIGQKGSSTFNGSVMNGSIGNTNFPTTAITKLGSGTLTLAGDSSYTGTTSVGGGTLVINGSNGASSVTVSNGATLGGAGTIGGLLTANSGGKVSPGNESAGTLMVGGGLTLNSATLNYDLANVPTAGGGVNDLISMSGGTLTFSGTTGLNPTLLNGSLANGSYTLIGGGSSTVSLAASFSWGGPSGGRQTFGFDTSTPGTLLLVVGGSPAGDLVWRGLVNSSWDTATSNWLNGAVSDRFYNLDTVWFDDTGLSAPIVNVTTAVTPAAVTVNLSGTYTFGGPGGLAGPGTFTKTGPGTLNMNLTNTSFTGNVLVSGGTLVMGIAGSVLTTGKLLLSNGGTFNLPPTSPLAYTFTGDIIVPAGQSGTIYSPGLANRLDGNIISGNNNSVLNISSGVSFGGTNSAQFDNFNGVIHVRSGASLRFSAPSSGNTYGSLNPTFIIDGALRPRNAGNTIRLGALSGTGSIEGPQSNAGSGDTTYIIGGNSLDVTFNGNISSNNATPGTVVVLKKIGTGKLVLNGASTFTGGTTVDAGSLIVGNTTGSGTGSGALSIAGGATLGGSGFIGSPTTLDDFAILAPGNSTGTLTFNDDLELGEFSELNFELGTNRDAVIANRALTLKGTLNVIPVSGFGAGAYTLFTYDPANTLNYSDLNLGTAPAGYNYSFDTNTIGTVKLVISLPTLPSFSRISMSRGNVLLSGNGGTPGADYCVLGATNIATPLMDWIRLVTNQFDSSGNFVWTNLPAPGIPREFYRLTCP